MPESDFVLPDYCVIKYHATDETSCLKCICQKRPLEKPAEALIVLLEEANTFLSAQPLQVAVGFPSIMRRQKLRGEILSLLAVD
jgi:hypothetical protein